MSCRTCTSIIITVSAKSLTSVLAVEDKRALGKMHSYKLIMKKLLFFILIIIAALGEAQRKDTYDFKWTSSSLFPNGTVVQACVGENVTFPWKFDTTLSQGIAIRWIRTSEIKLDQKKHSDLASYNKGTFYGLSPERDVEFLPNAGIKLPKVTLSDKGVYTVEISGSHKQVAFLNVYDVPVIASDELHAFILPESVYNLTTGLWYVRLGCRPPVIQGQSALPVIWTTPSNQTAISTSYKNNTFILALPSPVEEGDYSCSLNWSVPAVKCLSTHLNTRRAATVNVKRVNSRLSYLDKIVETLLFETANLNGSLFNLSDIVQHLQTIDKKCNEEIINLNQTTENINSFLQNLQTKNDEMTSKINYLESITTTADIKYDNMSVMILNKFDNFTDVIQRNNCCMTAQFQNKFDNVTAMVQRNNDNITAMVQSKLDNFAGMVQIKFDNITSMVQRNNNSITAMFQTNNDNISAMVQSRLDNITFNVENKFDTITSMVQRNNDNITAMVQINNNNVTAMVQRNNDNITAMVQSKLDNFAGMVQSKFDNINAFVQSKIDGITSMVQSKIDGITSMVHSKFDNVNAIVRQQQSDLMDSVHRPSSCVDVQKYDKVSGVHTLFVNNNIPVKVYCDQQTDNGGWTVIQRRQDGSVDFYRNWEQYEKGFGDLKGEFWIGLANLYLLTRNNSKLRIDLTGFDGSIDYAMYNTFSISGAQDHYRLNVGGYTGTAGDSLARHNKMRFSTFDRDHDTWSDGNCAEHRHGAWWYAACYDSSLNGRYRSNGAYDLDGVNWYVRDKEYKSFKRVEMKIKP